MSSLSYQHILVPVDLRPHSALVLQRAAQIARACNAQLRVLHVVEYLPIDPVGDTIAPTPLEVTDELAAAAKVKLTELCAQCEVADANQHVVVGRTQEEISRAMTDTEDLAAIDLVVFGNHERHGLSTLFSRTEDHILHHAQCDVLAVSLPN